MRDQHSTLNKERRVNDNYLITKTRFGLSEVLNSIYHDYIYIYLRIGGELIIIEIDSTYLISIELCLPNNFFFQLINCAKLKGSSMVLLNTN